MTVPLRDVGGSLTPMGFFMGARYAFSGIAFTFKHRRLLLWSVVPMLVQALLFVGLVVAGVKGLDLMMASLRPEAGHWYSFVGSIEWFIGLVLMLMAAVLLSLMLGNVLCDPFYDTLSEATESLLVGRDVATKSTWATFIGGIIREFTALPWRVGVYALVAVPLWLISLTGVGSVIAMPLTLAWTWMFVSLSGLSRSLSRHAVPGRRRLVIIFKRPAVSLGFGAVGWLLSHVPLTYPFLVVGGTRLHLALAAHDRLASNLSDDDKRVLKGQL